MTASADMWSLGVMLYEMLSGGESPFWAGDVPATARRITKCAYTLRHPGLAKTSTEATDCIRSLIRSRPEDRPAAEECLRCPFLSPVSSQEDERERSNTAPDIRRAQRERRRSRERARRLMSLV